MYAFLLLVGGSTRDAIIIFLRSANCLLYAAELGPNTNQTSQNQQYMHMMFRMMLQFVSVDTSTWERNHPLWRFSNWSPLMLIHWVRNWRVILYGVWILRLGCGIREERERQLVGLFKSFFSLQLFEKKWRICKNWFSTNTVGHNSELRAHQTSVLTFNNNKPARRKLSWDFVSPNLDQYPHNICLLQDTKSCCVIVLFNLYYSYCAQNRYTPITHTHGNTRI